MCAQARTSAPCTARLRAATRSSCSWPTCPRALRRPRTGCGAARRSCARRREGGAGARGAPPAMPAAVVARGACAHTYTRTHTHTHPVAAALWVVTRFSFDRARARRGAAALTSGLSQTRRRALRPQGHAGVAQGAWNVNFRSANGKTEVPKTKLTSVVSPNAFLECSSSAVGLRSARYQPYQRVA